MHGTKKITGSTTYNFAYGNFAQTSEIKVGTQTLAPYTYTDETNYLKKLAYGNGDSVSYTYDKHGRELESMINGSTTWEYTYNADGLRTRRTDGTDTYEYTVFGTSANLIAAATYSASVDTIH